MCNVVILKSALHYFVSVVSHVEQVLAIELLAACQALEFHRPRTTTAPLEDIYKLVRTVVRWAVPFHDNITLHFLRNFPDHGIKIAIWHLILKPPQNY